MENDSNIEEDMKIVASHVAILVPSVQKAADYLRRFDFQIEEMHEWDSEGTREIYVEKNKNNSLLLVEAFKPGPFQKALEKRGPGLHHLAIDVLDLENYIHSISDSGWLLHPKSLHTMKHTKTAYLAKPGFPGLIEVQQKEKLDDLSLFVSEISIPLGASEKLLMSVGLKGIVKHSNSGAEFLLGSHRVHLKDLL